MTSLKQSCTLVGACVGVLCKVYVWTLSSLGAKVKKVKARGQ